MNLNHDLSEKDGTYEELLPHISSREDMLCAEDIRLKFDALNLSKFHINNILISSVGLFENCVQELLLQKSQSKGIGAVDET